MSTTPSAGFFTARNLAAMACSMALLAAMPAAQARTVSAWDISGVAPDSSANLAVGELATGADPAAPSNPVLTAGGQDPYSMSSASASYVDQSVSSANYSSCQTNKLVSCVTLTSYPKSWACSCTTPTHPGGAPEPGGLALLGVGLLGLLLSQARARRRGL